MRSPARFHLIIEDRSRLQRICDVRITHWRVIAGVSFSLLAAFAIGLTLVLATPLRRLLPGHLDASQRALAEETMLRLDSMNRALQETHTYINNLHTVFDTRRPAMPAKSRRLAAALSPDSLMETSPQEIRFNARFSQRERIDLSAMADAAAEAVMFTPPAAECVVGPLPGDPLVARVIMGMGQPVGAPADGRVVAVFFDPSSGWSVVMQHAKGFVSRYSRLGRPLVEAGDMVDGSQIIALTSENEGRSGSLIDFQLWHNSTPLRPYTYIAPARITPEQ